MSVKPYEEISLTHGKVRIFDFSNIRLHACQTGDPLEDECFILEKNSKGIVIESPCFKNNIDELTAYIKGLGLTIEGVLLSYHMAGGSFLPDVRKVTTRHAEQYGRQGGGKALIGQFASVFGSDFDPTIHDVTDRVENGPVKLAGIDLNLIPTEEAFDIDIPEIHVLYTHMLGHDCHSIVAGNRHCDTLIADMKKWQEKGYNLILSSHHVPETLEDVQTKIAYLENLNKLAQASASAKSFKQAMEKHYPDYAGKNYLDMTAGFFFPEK